MAPPARSEALRPPLQTQYNEDGPQGQSGELMGYQSLACMGEVPRHTHLSRFMRWPRPMDKPTAPSRSWAVCVKNYESEYHKMKWNKLYQKEYNLNSHSNQSFIYLKVIDEVNYTVQHTSLEKHADKGEERLLLVLMPGYHWISHISWAKLLSPV